MTGSTPPPRLILFSAFAGLLVPALILTFLAFGFPTDDTALNFNLTSGLWPAYSMLVVGWRTTPRGIAITLFAVATNSLLYVGTAVVLKAAMRSIGKGLS